MTPRDGLFLFQDKAQHLEQCFWEVLEESRNMSRLPLVTLTYLLSTSEPEKAGKCASEEFLKPNNVSPWHLCT